MRDGEVVASESAAEVRAKLLRAARFFEARIAAGQDEEESVEAEAGAILEAEMACEIHEIRELLKAWAEAQ